MNRGLQALKRHLSQSTPKDVSTESVVSSNLLPPHIHIVSNFKAQKPGVLDPYLVTVSCSIGACYELQAAGAALRSLSQEYWTLITLTNRVTLLPTPQRLLGLQHKLDHRIAHC